jgi:hypothetical protein
MKIATDILREKFGKIKLEILKQDNVTREIMIVSEKKVCSYAIVKFNLDVARKISRAHKKILGGGLLAQTLRERKIKFRREEICSFFYFAPEVVKKIFGINEGKVYVKRVDIVIKKEVYASIFELYSSKLDFCDLYENVSGSILKSLENLNSRFNCNGFIV